MLEGICEWNVDVDFLKDLQNLGKLTIKLLFLEFLRKWQWWRDDGWIIWERNTLRLLCYFWLLFLNLDLMFNLNFFTLFFLMFRRFNFSSTSECNGFIVISWILLSVTRKLSFLLILHLRCKLAHLHLQGIHSGTYVSAVSLNTFQSGLIFIEFPPSLHNKSAQQLFHRWILSHHRLRKTW